MDSPALPTAAILHANLMESRVYHELKVVLTAAIASGILELQNRTNSFRVRKAIPPSP